MMGTSLSGIIPLGKRIKMVEIFGYSTKGIPGLEIIGLKNLSRQIREKIFRVSSFTSLLELGRSHSYGTS